MITVDIKKAIPLLYTIKPERMIASYSLILLRITSFQVGYYYMMFLCVIMHKSIKIITTIIVVFSN